MSYLSYMHFGRKILDMYLHIFSLASYEILVGQRKNIQNIMNRKKDIFKNSFAC